MSIDTVTVQAYCVSLSDPQISMHRFECESADYSSELFDLQLLSVTGMECLAVDHLGRRITCFEDIVDACSPHDSVVEPAGSLPIVELWLIPREVFSSTSDASEDHSLSITVCSRLFLKSESESEVKALQPLYNIVDTAFTICPSCLTRFDSDLQGDLLGPKPTAGACRVSEAEELGICLPSSNVISTSGALRSGYGDNICVPEPVRLFVLRCLWSNFVASQRSYRSLIAYAEASSNFRRRVESTCKSVQVYESPNQKAITRRVIDLETINRYAQVHITNANNSMPGDVAFMHGLLQWFRCDFFEWCNKPDCAACKASGVAMNIECIGMIEPNEYERVTCWAGRVELYKCQNCKTLVRFPRINNPAILLTESRRGRCGEFANAFCMLCRALGIDAAYVLDFTDHVWVEVWIPSLRRYVHVDCCERALDTPLVYESGWGKQLTYVLSVSRHFVVDSTTRYTRRWSDVLVRRHLPLESDVRAILSEANAMMLRYFSDLILPTCIEMQDGVDNFIIPPHQWGATEDESIPQDISGSTSAVRRRLNYRELEGCAFLTTQAWKPAELIGRISGDAAWKRARGEDGPVIA